MTSVGLEQVLLLSAALFVLGLVAVMVRRNVVFMLMGLEIMFSATGLAFIAAGARWAQADGQIMYILIISLAAAEAAIGLALILRIYHTLLTVDADAAAAMRG